MKKSISYLFFIMVLISCNKNIDNKIFDSIRAGDTITLYYQDDKFGEWGGDEFFLKVFIDKSKNSFVADLQQKEMLSANPNLAKKIKECKNIKFEESNLRNLDLAIKELFYQKKENKISCNSGFHSYIKNNNDSIIISVYSSSRWNSFEDLIKNIKKNVRKD